MTTACTGAKRHHYAGHHGTSARSRTHLWVQMLIFSAVRGGMSSCATFQAAPEPSGALISTTLPCDTSPVVSNMHNSQV